MSNNNLKSAIEALLFASDKPLSIQQIKEALDSQDTEAIQIAIEELKKEYEVNQRGMRINEVAGGYQMVTALDFASFLKRLYKTRRVERLSRPALETLAIIAYKQPLTKHEIQLLRNVNTDGVIKHLLEKGLIRISGRKKAPGRPYVFSTTRQFLEYFGLRSLEDLPKTPELNQKLNLEGDKKDETEKITPEN